LLGLKYNRGVCEAQVLVNNFKVTLTHVMRFAGTKERQETGNGKLGSVHVFRLADWGALHGVAEFKKAASNERYSF